MFLPYFMHYLAEKNGLLKVGKNKTPLKPNKPNPPPPLPGRKSPVRRGLGILALIDLIRSKLKAAYFPEII